jgi:hypothetical protein
MTIKSLGVAVCLKSLLIATVIFIPGVSLFSSTSMSQDIGGIIGGMMRLQQQQYYNGRQYQRRRHSEDGDSSKENGEVNRKKENDERQKAEEVKTQAQAAKDLIEDASSFVKDNPSNPRLIEFVEKINDLDAALILGNPLKLKHLMEELSGALRHEPGFEVMEANRIGKNEQEAARYLPELITTSKQQQSFIRNYIMNNPTARPTAKLIPLIKELDSNLAKPNLNQLKMLTSKVDVSIRAAGLTDDFLKSKNNLEDPLTGKGSREFPDNH